MSTGSLGFLIVTELEILYLPAASYALAYTLTPLVVGMEVEQLYGAEESLHFTVRRPHKS